MTTLDKIRKLCDENLTTISKLEKHLGFGDVGQLLNGIKVSLGLIS